MTGRERGREGELDMAVEYSIRRVRLALYQTLAYGGVRGGEGRCCFLYHIASHYIILDVEDDWGRQREEGVVYTT